MTYGSPTKYALIGKESVWGTGVTADKDVGLILDITDGGNQADRGLGEVDFW